MGGRVRPLWQIKQAPKEIQGGNTQCEHPERKSLRGSGNTIPQESGCLCIQETRYHGGNHRTIKGKDTRYKLYWSGNDKGTAGVGVFVAEEWIEKVFEVERVSDRIILVKVVVGQRVVTFLSVYAGEMSMSEDSKQKAWLEHYQRLLNVEFDWDPDHLSYQPPVEGLPIPITTDMVKKAISQMKAGKAPGPSGIVVEMIQAAGDMGAHDL